MPPPTTRKSVVRAAVTAVAPLRGGSAAVYEGTAGGGAADVGTPLVAAEEPELAVHRRAEGERVQHEVELHAGGQAEHRGQTEPLRLHPAGPIEQDVLAEHPGPGV